ncbi:family 78 glycoside hydrolase catalytic domain [Ruminococcus sp. 1001136sp1]|uniref:family 78 glycoside hydrolase catalytic domain n=1 Tax=unclassified Ruminococcus TaxID=2608920 RepID=UPI00189F2B27|nr:MULTISPECIES: family 78 glycoside hydrolase catalytic domain [unclassified Ruminococcus]MDB8770600.1 family 78 glycoside hydrolase catalytic domain [Ruminococcus sp. 1001136sp1]MDB8783567.1 family 78 glycoside hydrolase catalytic domain [Ruminococcus sp. 1001136sp1]
MLRINEFKVENLSSGCVTDNPAPVFSFSMISSEKNVLLKKAVLSVNNWMEEFRQQTGIVYNGPKLTPFTRYLATLEITDNYGETASTSLEFETGFVGKEWNASWITDDAYQFKERKKSPRPMTFKKDFFIKGEIRQARIYSTAFGIYELELNGKKMGNDYFAPGYTSYKHQLQYQMYDITEELRKQNQLVAVVGGGWAAGSYTYKRMNRIYAKRQAFLGEIHILYKDGTQEIISTDETWQVTENGNFREAEFYDGEVYDATVNLEKASFHNASIEKVKIRPQLLAQYGSLVKAHEQFEPISCQISPSGMLIYDFGQNMAGVIQADIQGRAGERIVFHHAEVLLDGELYTKPLRSARQQAVYICKEGEQKYSPRMTYMGFRYVGVSGIPVDRIKLKAVALYSDLPENGEFSCSEPMLDKLQSCIEWSAKSNFVDIPTDCPQRDERLGWTGDIALFAPTAAYNFDMSRFFDKWLKDMRAEQNQGGGIPMIVPMVKIPGQFEMMFPLAADHWGDACILVPWAEYKARGDIELLRKMYPSMKKYIKACKFWAGLFSAPKNKRIWKLLFHYGDWCAPDMGYKDWMKRGKWTGTACLAHSSGIVSEIAGVLGETEEAEEYMKLSQETARAYRNILMDENCHIKGGDFQTAFVLPLYYNMLSGNDKKKTAANLVNLIRDNNYNIKTGFPGTPYVLFALADNGYLEDAYKMLLADTCPSWLYEVKAGATTMWERWDALREDGSCNLGEDNGSGGMVSFNHYANGAVGDFFYRRILGIEATEGGYKTFRIAPQPGGGLSWAKGNVNTPYGRIRVSWTIENDRFKLEIEVPAGTRCEIILPSGRKVTEGSGSYSYEELLG